VEIMQANVV